MFSEQKEKRISKKKAAIKYFRTKQLNTSFKQNKLMNNVKAVKDDEVRLKRCDEKYSQLDLMHRFILQKLEILFYVQDLFWDPLLQ